jgi:hypothetical protein
MVPHQTWIYVYVEAITSPSRHFTLLNLKMYQLNNNNVDDSSSSSSAFEEDLCALLMVMVNTLVLLKIPPFWQHSRFHASQNWCLNRKFERDMSCNIRWFHVNLQRDNCVFVLNVYKWKKPPQQIYCSCVFTWNHVTW